MVLVTLANALIASTFPLIKIALEYGKPIFLVGVRMVLAGLLLIGYEKFWTKRFRINREDYFLFGLLGLTHIFLAFVFECLALADPLMSSAKACLFFSFSPFIIALLSYLYFAEKLSLGKWIGLGIGCFGLFPLLMFRAPETLFFYFLSKSEIFLIIAVLGSCFGWIIFKKLLQKQYSVVSINGIAMLIGGIFALITSIGIEGVFPVTRVLPFLYYILILILVANVLYYNLYGFLLKKYTATFLSFAAFTTPLFTALFAWALCDEPVTLSFMVSFTTVFIGLYIFYREEIKLF